MGGKPQASLGTLKHAFPSSSSLFSQDLTLTPTKPALVKLAVTSVLRKSRSAPSFTLPVFFSLRPCFRNILCAWFLALHTLLGFLSHSHVLTVPHVDSLERWDVSVQTLGLLSH